MNRFRITVFLFGIFVLLLFVVLFYGTESANQKKNQNKISEPLLSESQINRLTEITFLQNGVATTLKKGDDGSFRIEDLLVDPDLEKRLVEELSKLPRGKRVSKNKENAQKYGLSEGIASEFIVSIKEKPVLDLLFGARGTTFDTWYVKEKEKNDLYLVSTGIQKFFSYGVNEFRDLRLFPISKDQVKQLSVRIGTEKWKFVREENVWKQDVNGTFEAVDSELFQDYLKDILSLKASKVPPGLTGFSDPVNAVSISLEDGKEHVVSIALSEAKEEKDRKAFAMVSGQSAVFELPSDFSARLKPGFLMKKEEAVSSEEEKKN